MANCIGQNFGVRWDLLKAHPGDPFSSKDIRTEVPPVDKADIESGFTPSDVIMGSACGSDPVNDVLGVSSSAYSKITGFSYNLIENSHENHDEHSFSLWNQGKDIGNVEKQLSPTSISGNGCHLFEDLVSKILDEDNSSQSLSEHGDYFDECFSKTGKMKNFDHEKCAWFEGKRGHFCHQGLLDVSKSSQANGKNGPNLSQTHSASDIFNLNGNNHSWKQKSSSDHFIPDFKSDSFKEFSDKESVTQASHMEMKHLYGNGNLLMGEMKIDCSSEFVLGNSVGQGDLSSNLNDRSTLLALSNGQLRNDSKMNNINLVQDFFPKSMIETSQKYDSSWFLPLSLNNQDYLNTLIMPTYSVDNKFEGLSSKSAQCMPSVEQKTTWSQKECDGLNSLLFQNNETKKVVDALLSAGVQYPVSAVRPLLKRSNFEFENDTKQDVMSLIGGSFIQQDYINPDIYPNPLVPRFVPLALLNHGVRNGLSQVKMTPIFVKPSQESGTQQMKSISRRPMASSMVDYYLEHCFEQLNCLEIEESKVEGELCKLKILSSSGSSVSANFPRFSHNSTRVNHLVAESLKQHSKINAMLMKIKKMSSHPLHANIYSAMDTWLEGIRKVQARRKEEIVSSANRNNNSGSRVVEDKDNMALSSAIEELLGQTRKARTALWCAFQMCLFACSSPSEIKEMNYDPVQF